MKRTCECLKCKKETSHYYFMMMPMGYWVCDVCGTPEGEKGEPKWYLFLEDIEESWMDEFVFTCGLCWQNENGGKIWMTWDILKKFISDNPDQKLNWVIDESDLVKFPEHIRSKFVDKDGYWKRVPGTLTLTKEEGV